MSWKTRKQRIITQLKKGNPVLVRKDREDKNGCLGEKGSGLNPYTNQVTSHYYILAGMKGGQVAVLPGWGKNRDKGKNDTWSLYKNSKTANTHRKCTWSQLEKDGLTVVTQSRGARRSCADQVDCKRGDYCHKVWGKTYQNRCRTRKSRGRSCKKNYECRSNKCKRKKCT